MKWKKMTLVWKHHTPMEHFFFLWLIQISPPPWHHRQEWHMNNFLLLFFSPTRCGKRSKFSTQNTLFSPFWNFSRHMKNLTALWSLKFRKFGMNCMSTKTWLRFFLSAHTKKSIGLCCAFYQKAIGGTSRIVFFFLSTVFLSFFVPFFPLPSNVSLITTFKKEKNGLQTK